MYECDYNFYVLSSVNGVWHDLMTKGSIDSKSLNSLSPGHVRIIKRFDKLAWMKQLAIVEVDMEFQPFFLA